MSAKKVSNILSIIALLFLQPLAANNNPVGLTVAEKEWIKQNPLVTMCVDPDWYPFESINRHGEHIGISSELIKIISQRTGLTFELIPTKDWQETLEYSRTGKCDILSFLNRSNQRDNWLIFTEPYYTELNVFITREDHEYITDLAGLDNHSIVIPSQTSIEETIRREYPNLKIIIVDTETDAFKMVNDRKADITLRSLTMAAYTIKKEGWFNLKIAGQLPQISNTLRMGITKQDTVLQSILNKAIATITPKEVHDIVDDHISVNVVAPTDYRLLIIVVIFFSLVLALGLLWNKQLRSLNKELQEKRNRLLEISRKQSKDIENRKRMEKELRAHQQQLKQHSEMVRLLMNSTAEAIYGVDNQGNCTFINQAGLNILGFENQDHVLGKNMHQLIHHTKADGTPYPVDQCSIHTSYTQNKKTNNYNELFFRADNTAFSVEYWSYPIIKDEEVIGAVVTFFDISLRLQNEQAITESEKKYRLITENTSDVIWVFNLNRNCFTFISPSVFQLRGYTVEEALRQNPRNSLTPKSLERVEYMIEEAAKMLRKDPEMEIDTRNIELQQPCKNGDIIWVEVTTMIRLNKHGEMEITGVSRNIEERKKMEATILYKNDMQQLVNTISTDFITASIENIDDKLMKALRMAGEFFSMDRAYLFRHTSDKKFFYISHEWCADGVEHSYEDNQQIAFSDFPWWNAQIRDNIPISIDSIDDMPLIAVKEKEEMQQQGIKTLICFPVMINGIITGLLGFDAVKEQVDLSSEQKLSMQLITNIISDTLERIKAEKAHIESEKTSRETAARYQAFIDASNTGAWEYNMLTGNLWCSTKYFNMLGYTGEEFDLSPDYNAYSIWTQLTHPDDFAQTDAYMQDFLKNPENIYQQVFRMRHKNGSDVWILSRGRNLIDHTGQPGAVIVGTHIDITEQKNAEETILLKNKELETYLYVASHDLRSPLINIQGFGVRIQTHIDKLTQEIHGVIPKELAPALLHVTTEVVPRSLSIIFSNVEKMNDLINGLLAISRTGRVKMKIEECDMNLLAKKIIKTHAFQLEDLSAAIEITPLPPCFGDEGMLSQLFSNLIDNAMKYRKPDNPLQIKIEGKRANGGVVYSITDNGIGISERNQQKIWDIFYRVDPSSAHKGEGIGLNLAAKIAEKHKGQIWVTSTEGEGSTFFVELRAVEFSE